MCVGVRPGGWYPLKRWSWRKREKKHRIAGTVTYRSLIQVSLGKLIGSAFTAQRLWDDTSSLTVKEVFLEFWVQTRCFALPMWWNNWRGLQERPILTKVCPYRLLMEVMSWSARTKTSSELFIDFCCMMDFIVYDSCDSLPVCLCWCKVTSLWLLSLYFLFYFVNHFLRSCVWFPVTSPVLCFPLMVCTCS